MPTWMSAGLERQSGLCSLAEFRIPAEVAAAGISSKRNTVAFPWACGGFPLPDAMPLYLIVTEEQRSRTHTDIQTSSAWVVLPTFGTALQRNDLSASQTLLV